MRFSASSLLCILAVLLLLSACAGKRGVETLHFDPYSRGYRYENNRWMLEFAKLAYGEEEDFRSAVEDWDLGNHLRIKLISDQQSDAQVYLVSSNRLIVIAFRGTENLTDLLKDLQFWKEHNEWGQIHQGFAAQYKALIPKLNRELKKIHRHQMIWITGHSLGGALAAIYANHINARSRPFIRGIYTYGQPRVGDAKFAHNLNRHFPTAYFRITNAGDQVPLVPKLDYEHAGTEIFYDEEGTPFCGRPQKDLLQKIWSETKVFSKGLLGDFEGHSLARYEQRMEEPQLIRKQSKPPQGPNRCRFIAGKGKA